MYMLGKLNLFLICLQCIKLLEKTTNNFLSCVAVGAFLLIDIAGLIEYNRINCLPFLLETDIDDCAGHPCKNNGTCTDQVNGFNCSCAPGFNGTHCETGNRNR